MKALVLTEHYPDMNGDKNMMYVHTRNIFYINNGNDVDVLCFSKKRAYEIDGIKVFPIKEFDISQKQYDVLILHAANIKHHYLFLQKYGKYFKKQIFFFHGHEVLKKNKTYSKPYAFLNKSKYKEIIQDVYDDYKLRLWHRYFSKYYNKSYFIFVSKWMKEQFFKWTKLPEKIIENRSSITYNCVGKLFEEKEYSCSKEKIYDFITIRGNLDNSKYAIDIVNRFANNTPKGKFLVIGNGKIFQFIKKAENIDWRETTLSHEEIIYYLDQAKYALMPTRTDAQGVMMCEMAAYGIPVITSDIPVCHEIFDGFENAFFINNDNKSINLDCFFDKNITPVKMNRFYQNNTVMVELNNILNFLQQ